jgi:pimeloyl-ACP methyl ester carboxylesterase
MQVELVSTTTSDDVRLDGYLRVPSETPDPSQSLDVVVCLHGVGGNFYGPSFFDRIGAKFLDRKCAVLRVNSRGHDQAFQTAGMRLGAAYEIVDECRLDIKAWLDYAEQRGFRRAILWGHSLGAVKAVYYQAVAEEDPRVIGAIASSPPRFSYKAYLVTEEGERFLADITRAQELIDAEKPTELLEVLVPVARTFSALTYVDKYGPRARYDYFQHLPKVGKPLLLTLGSLEADNPSFAPLAEMGPALATRWPAVSYQLIYGADHAYADHTDELWTAVASWLPRVTGAGRQPDSTGSVRV